MEWTINQIVFKQIMNIFGPCDIDMCASKLNNQLPRYFSYTPDVQAVTLNAFSLNWTNYFSYMFPPFSLI